jgi:hypothetical protein
MSSQDWTQEQQKFQRGIAINKSSESGIMVDVASPSFGWRDIIGTTTAKETGAGNPSWQVYRGGEQKELAFVAGDKIYLDFHIPHDHVKGTDLFIHAHWSHNGTAISGPAIMDFYSTYARGHNQDVFGAEKNQHLVYVTESLALTPKYRHRIDEVPLSKPGGSESLLDTDAIEPDGLILMAFKVTTLPTITGGDLFVHFVDIHYQTNNLGTKQKAPNFYL